MGIGDSQPIIYSLFVFHSLLILLNLTLFLNFRHRVRCIIYLAHIQVPYIPYMRIRLAIFFMQRQDTELLRRLWLIGKFYDGILNYQRSSSFINFQGRNIEFEYLFLCESRNHRTLNNKWKRLVSRFCAPLGIQMRNYINKF